MTVRKVASRGNSGGGRQCREREGETWSGSIKDVWLGGRVRVGAKGRYGEVVETLDVTMVLFQVGSLRGEKLFGCLLGKSEQKRREKRRCRVIDAKRSSSVGTYLNTQTQTHKYSSKDSSWLDCIRVHTLLVLFNVHLLCVRAGSRS
jgi:hypothetical protein